jgi:hypothetical protein
MSNSKHTPAPWKAHESTSIDPEWATVQAGQSIIANVNADTRQMANAHLIAAAPELLEAIKALLKYDPDWARVDPNGFEELWNKVAIKARAAIAKANGQEAA